MYFQNNSNLPIVVETWIKIKEGLSKLIDICILPNETKEINSLTNEWNIHRMFCEDENSELWKNYITSSDNKTIPIYLGKFRDQQAYNDECIWLDTNIFSLNKKDNIFIWDNKI
jgi:hypothetical protein